MELPQRAPPTFDWAAITFGIGPHSSLNYNFHRNVNARPVEPRVEDGVLGGGADKGSGERCKLP